MVAKPMKQIQSTYISKVACGLEHTLLLTSSGFVYSMGRNGRGQLGREQQSVPDLMIPANDEATVTMARSWPIAGMKDNKTRMRQHHR